MNSFSLVHSLEDGFYKFLHQPHIYAHFNKIHGVTKTRKLLACFFLDTALSENSPYQFGAEADYSNLYRKSLQFIWQIVAIYSAGGWRPLVSLLRDGSYNGRLKTVLQY
jgi:hypothetical protein